MRVRRLDHVLLAMPAGRESDARQFYHGILGIPEATKPADLAGRGGCWFEDGELKIHLGVEKNFVPASPGCRFAVRKIRAARGTSPLIT